MRDDAFYHFIDVHHNVPSEVFLEQASWVHGYRVRTDVKNWWEKGK